MTVSFLPFVVLLSLLYRSICWCLFILYTHTVYTEWWLFGASERDLIPVSITKPVVFQGLIHQKSRPSTRIYLFGLYLFFRAVLYANRGRYILWSLFSVLYCTRTGVDISCGVYFQCCTHRARYIFSINCLQGYWKFYSSTPGATNQKIQKFYHRLPMVKKCFFNYDFQ